MTRDSRPYVPPHTRSTPDVGVIQPLNDRNARICFIEPCSKMICLSKMQHLQVHC